MSSHDGLNGKTRAPGVELRTGAHYANLILNQSIFARTLGQHFGVDPNNVVPTAGATGAIEAVRNHVLKTSRKKHPHLLTVSPGYWRAREAFQGLGFQVIDFKTVQGDFTLNEQEFVRTVREKKLLIWPMLASLIALGFLIVKKDQEGSSTIVVTVLALGAAPTILLLVPIIYLLFITLTVNLAGVVALLLVLFLGLLIPQLHYLTSHPRWLLPGVMFAVSLLCIAVGLAYSGFDKAHPRPDNLFYGLNADKHEAVWASGDRRPDEWTAQFLSRTPQAGPLEEFFPGTPRNYLKAPAPIADLQAPDLKVINDSPQGDVRILRLRLTSPRQAPLIAIYAEPGAEIRRVAINGKQETVKQSVNAKIPWVMRYSALPAEGIDLVLEINPSQPLKLVVVDQSYGLPPLPDFTAKTRPENVMPSSSTSSDATFVRRSFSF